MSVAIPIPLLQNLPDVNVSLGVGVDENMLVYDHDTARFVLRAPAAPFAGLLATGATVGATAQAQAFTNGIVSPFSAPAADSTTAWQVRKADGTTPVVTVDTTNGNVIIGSIADPYYATQKLLVLKDIDGECAIAVGNPNTAGASGATVTNLIAGSTTSQVVITNESYAQPLLYGTVKSSLQFINRSAGPIIFKTNGYSDAQERVRITSLGNVGIGTIVPVTRLDIDAGALTMAEMTAPTGVANKATVYARDNGSGKTMYCLKLGDDVEIVLATQA